MYVYISYSFHKYNKHITKQKEYQTTYIIINRNVCMYTYVSMYTCRDIASLSLMPGHTFSSCLSTLKWSTTGMLVHISLTTIVVHNRDRHMFILLLFIFILFILFIFDTPTAKLADFLMLASTDACR